MLRRVAGRRKQRAATLATLLVASGCGGDPEVQQRGGIEGRVEGWLDRMSLEQKIAQMHGSGMAPVDGLYLTPEDEALGIPSYKMVDGPRGVRAGKATTFPVPMARAATFNTQLEQRVGEAIGLETAAKGGNVILAPAVNNVRHPRWGRAQETYGEDVCLLGAMGSAFVTGAQEHVLASLKHYAANSIEDRRMSVDVSIDERTLREIYTRHFEQVVRHARPASVMTAYNSVNGHYSSENAHLLRDLLYGEWEFDGFVESDWLTGTRSTVEAANAGLCIEMPMGAYFDQKDLGAAVEQGTVKESVIDESVRRILRKKLEFSLDAPEQVPADVVESQEHTDLTREVEREAIVLLKNEGAALPLDRAKLATLALVGQLADTKNLGDAGSSNAEPSWAVTPRAGLVDRAGSGTKLDYIPGPTLAPADLATLAAADAAVVVVGLTAKEEGENFEALGGGDRESLDLPQEQLALIAAVAAQNARTIVVLEGSGPVIVAPWLDQVEALLMVWYPGQEGGHAIADVLFGDVSPSGKLPLTFPASEAQLPAFVNDQDAVTYDYFHGYRYVDAKGLDPSFPFGFGLSYTSFVFGELGLAETTLSDGATVHASIDVTNTGKAAGKTVVQLYASYPSSAVERAPRELKAFAKVDLQPGETKNVALEFPVRDLAYWDVGVGSWVVEPTSVQLWAGDSSRNLPASAELKLE